jgi:predicted kinase
MTMSAQAHRQTLLLLKGHPATGKSTLATALARYLAWPLIDKDDIKDHLYPLPNSGHLSYEVLWQIVRRQLEIGLSVIVDSTLSYPQSYATGQQLATTYHARLLVVETKLAEASWKARLEQRLDEVQTHRTSGWDAMQQLLVDYAGSWHYPIAPEHHLTVDTSLPTLQLVQIIADHLAQQITTDPANPTDHLDNERHDHLPK